jgi:hypothetical protein
MSNAAVGAVVASGMTNDLRATWDTYASAWKATAADDKASALRASVAATAIYRDPLTEAKGHAALIAAMIDFHQRVPGGHFVTTHFEAHHDRSLARWTMHDAAGAVLGDGTSFGEYGPDGRLVAMTGFYATA